MISITVCTDLNNGIGYKNQLPWKDSFSDLKWFKQKTEGHVVIMGHNTWQSLPTRPLLNRVNIILTKQRSVKHDILYGCRNPNILVCHDLRGAINLHPNKETFIIGGSQVYYDALNFDMVDKIYLTRILATFTCDRYFPEIPPNWKGDMVYSHSEMLTDWSTGRADEMLITSRDFDWVQFELTRV
jgi:dihydrofolate reductase